MKTATSIIDAEAGTIGAAPDGEIPEIPEIPEY
jgi:hypothetical protein